MLAEANAAVPRLNPAEVRDMIGKENVLIVDVRDAPELASGGKLRGAVTVSPGLLEFRAHPESPYHNPDFQKDRTVLDRRPRRIERQDVEGPRLPIRL
jgi:predicted sulfurtransferase